VSAHRIELEMMQTERDDLELNLDNTMDPQQNLDLLELVIKDLSSGNEGLKDNILDYKVMLEERDHALSEARNSDLGMKKEMVLQAKKEIIKEVYNTVQMGNKIGMDFEHHQENLRKSLKEAVEILEEY